MLFATALISSSAVAATRQVPSQYATIQAAVNAAVNGDVVLIAPGTYTEQPTLSGKAITVASHFHTTGKRSYIDQTIVDGGGGAYVFRVEPSVQVATIVGLTIRHASDGISANGRFDLLDCRVTNTTDGIDYESGSGGIVRGCTFEGNSDDGIDLDNETFSTIERNVIRNNGDDGIEIRLQQYTGPLLTTIIRDNTISGNGEDGIQLISYDVKTSRYIRIERNLVLDNAMAGLGMMCCSNTVEDFQGASALERVDLFHNTIAGNAYGVTGGDSLVALNNLIVNTPNIGLKNADAGSAASHNLFFANGTNHTGSNVNVGTSLFANPQLQPDWTLAAGSPAIDAGAASFAWYGLLVWNAPPGSFGGAAPDFGAREFGTVSVLAHEAEGTRLLAPAPNPGRGSIALGMVLALTGPVRLEIVDLSGRHVRTLVDDVVPAGRHEFAWDGRSDRGSAAPPGVYLARLVGAGFARTRRFTRL
jgi:hypothetical protein